MTRTIPNRVYRGIDPHVVRGARLLDISLGTDWDLAINLETLSLRDAGYCVLGQTFYVNPMRSPGYAWTRIDPSGKEIDYLYIGIGYDLGNEWLGTWARENDELLKKIDGAYHPSSYGFLLCSGFPCPEEHPPMSGYEMLQHHWATLIERRKKIGEAS